MRPVHDFPRADATTRCVPVYPRVRGHELILVKDSLRTGRINCCPHGTVT